MSRRQIAVMIVVALVVEGCGSAAKVERAHLSTAEEVLQHAHGRNELIRTISGTGSITIESPEMSGSLSFAAEMRKPDSVKVDLSGPFGIRIGTLALSKEEVLFYDRRQNRVIVGFPDDRTLRSLLQMHVRYEEIMEAFTGDFLSIDQTDSLEEFKMEEESYLFRYRDSAAVREFRVDPESFIVTSYRVLSPDGTASLVATASRNDDVDGVTVPTILRVILPLERRSITVAYGKVRINGEVNCSFSIPPEAEIIRR